MLGRIEVCCHPNKATAQQLRDGLATVSGHGRTGRALERTFPFCDAVTRAFVSCISLQIALGCVNVALAAAHKILCCQQGHPPAQVQQAGHQPGSGQVLRHPSRCWVTSRDEDTGRCWGARNPWWSDRVPSQEGGQPGASGLHGERHGSAQGALSSGRVKTADGLTHKDLLDIEARVQALKDVEAQIQMEIHKRKGENSVSGSFQSVVGEVGVRQGSKTSVDPTLGQLVMPPGPPARPVIPPAVTAATNVGENLTENLRNLEHQKLAPDSTSVDFGDWLAVVGPLMADDLSATSCQWWAFWSCRRRWTRTPPDALALWPRT